MIVRKSDISLSALRFVVACGAIAFVIIVHDPSAMTLPVVVVFAICLIRYRLDIMNIWIAFTLPWLMILTFSGINISDYSRPISHETVASIVVLLGIGLLLLPAQSAAATRRIQRPARVDDRVFKYMLVVYIMFCILNVALAGYVPLFRAITLGDSGYMDFGVKGVYGLFNAFANAFGLTAFYLWMSNRKRTLYMLSFFLVLCVFLLFLTRQNLISLLIESFVVYCAVVRRISGFRVLILALSVLFAFSIIGDFRVGADIAEIAAIKAEFLWVPRAFIWLFAYCYFNILNLDNVVATSPAPAFDGSSLAQLLPSFLRPEGDDGSDLLEVSSFTVDSFIAPIYHDFGILGLCVIFALLCLLVRWYNSLTRRGDFFLGITGYAVLYFCFLFSFFVNFWFYLPVIFQLVFFPIFKKLLLHGKHSGMAGVVP